MTKRDLQALSALVEKEVHTSRVPILGLLVLSTVAPFPSPGPGPVGLLYLLLRYAPSLIAVLWGATSGDYGNRKQAFDRTHLPVSDHLLLLVSFGLPCFVILAASALGALADDVLNGAGTSVADVLVPLLSAFSLAYFTSLMWSQRAGFTAGVLAVTLQAGSEGAVIGWSLCAGSGAAVLLMTLCRPRARGGILRPVCVGIVAGCVIFPVSLLIGPKMLASETEVFSPHTYNTPDATITVRTVNSAFSGDRIEAGVAEFRNVDTGQVYVRRFSGCWHTAWVADKRIAYCIEEDKARGGAMITRWDTVADTVRVVARLPVRPRWDTLCRPDHFASVDPGGRYMIARLPAISNSSVDLWLIDLRGGVARVVIQNAGYFEPVATRWLSGRALVPSYRSRIIEVDLERGTARYVGRAGEGN